MKDKMIKGGVAIAIIAVSVLGLIGIKSTAKQPDANAEVDTRPLVKIAPANAQLHQVVLTSHGEVKPLETTKVAAQVSGAVTHWHQNFVAGGLIARGEVLFSIEKDNYQAAVLQAEAAVISAEAKLVEEKAKAQVAQDEANRYPNKTHTDLFLRKPQVLSAEAQLKSAQAALKRAERDLKNTDVYAPYDALVVNRNLGSGQFVTPGAQVGEISNVEFAEVMLPIAGFDAVFLPKPLAGTVANVQFGDALGTTREGKIVRDLGTVDSATRMSHVVVRINDPYSLKSNLPVLKFGSYVDVTFNGQTLEQVFKLPQGLVANRTVWVVDNTNHLQAKAVNILRNEGEFFIIDKGLKEQDKLVTTLPEYPQQGMEVRVATGSLDAQQLR